MPSESLAKRKMRAGRIREILRSSYPDAKIALDYRNPLELLVATILSAQCTDKRVNMVTEALFKKYRTPAEYAAADPMEFEQEIRSTGFYHNKTKSILGATTRIQKQFNSRVPDNMDDLLTLPGVARKTANVVLGGAFGKNEGIVVDTHVTRVSRRLMLTQYEDNAADRIENDLLALVPRDEWADFGNRMIWHGRLICEARHPKCGDCAISKHCPSAFTFH